MNPIIHIDDAGRQLIYSNEGVRLREYRDSKGFGTIGIGHKLTPNDHFTILTQNQVDQLFEQDRIPRECDLINLSNSWDIPITQGEFNALISFMWQYVLCDPDYAHTKAAIVSGDRQSIINHLMQFKNINKGSGNEELLPRRMTEINMFKS